MAGEDKVWKVWDGPYRAKDKIKYGRVEKPKLGQTSEQPNCAKTVVVQTNSRVEGPTR